MNALIVIIVSAGVGQGRVGPLAGLAQGGFFAWHRSWSLSF